MKVKLKLLPSTEVKLIVTNEQVNKNLAILLDITGKKWHSCENKLDKPVRVIAKGIVLFLKKKNDNQNDDLVNRKFDEKFAGTS